MNPSIKAGRVKWVEPETGFGFIQAANSATLVSAECTLPITVLSGWVVAQSTGVLGSNHASSNIVRCDSNAETTTIYGAICTSTMVAVD